MSESKHFVREESALKLLTAANMAYNWFWKLKQPRTKNQIISPKKKWWGITKIACKCLSLLSFGLYTLIKKSANKKQKKTKMLSDYLALFP